MIKKEKITLYRQNSHTNSYNNYYFLEENNLD
jgi:hypothetical protein